MDWHTITLSGTDGTRLISIASQCNGKVLFNLTDFKVLWREENDLQELICRAKSENPHMNDVEDDNAIKRTIFSLANHYEFGANEGEQLLLKTKYYIGGVPFLFQWTLTKSSDDVFYEEITRKLLVSLLNERDRGNELIEIVKRKDAEISQYKIEGATLMRKHVATQPFHKPEFDRKFEIVSDSGLFDGTVNCSTMKQMCNYVGAIKSEDNISANAVIVGPSPSKIAKIYNKNKEENAMRKFKTKRDCKIQYESSSEKLISDTEETEQDINCNFETAAIVDSKKDPPIEAPKRKLKSKLNL